MSSDWAKPKPEAEALFDELEVVRAFNGRAECVELLAKRLADAARVPEGCVRTADGVDRQVLGTLPITADGCVAGLCSQLWGVYEDEGERAVVEWSGPWWDTSDCGPVWMQSDGEIPPSWCYSTREAAEAAIAQPTPAHGEGE